MFGYASGLSANLKVFDFAKIKIRSTMHLICSRDSLASNASRDNSNPLIWLLQGNYIYSVYIYIKAAVYIRIV